MKQLDKRLEMAAAYGSQLCGEALKEIEELRAEKYTLQAQLRQAGIVPQPHNRFKFKTDCKLANGR